MLTAMVAAAAVLAGVSTAYACVTNKGDATVTGTVRTSNLMTSSNPPGHAKYCAGREPIVAAAGPADSALSAKFAPATACNPTGGTTQLTDGTYTVRLRNTNAIVPNIGTPGPAWTGADNVGWTWTENSGCFNPLNTLDPRNFTLGTMRVTSGSGTFNGVVPTDALTNGPKDASVLCVGNNGVNNDGFLAPFRVSTI